MKPSGRAIGDAVFWFRCWMPEGARALQCPVVARGLEKVPAGLPTALWLFLPRSTGRTGTPRRVGDPQAQPKPSQVTLHCRGIWRGFGGCHTTEGQPKPCPCGRWGHRDLTGSADGGQMAPGTGQMAPSQPGSRGAGRTGASGAGLVPGASLCWPPAGGDGPRGTGTTGQRRCGHC